MTAARGIRRAGRVVTDPRARFAPAALLFCLVAALPGTVRAGGPTTPADELEIFKTWLDREHKGYGCDEGPAPFRNATVEAAYAGRRFYYVLTHTRGIAPPFRNALSLVARVDDNGKVQPLNPSDPSTYRTGLRKVSRAVEARRIAAAVLILAMGDPGERRWRFQEDLITVKKSRKGWTCRYRHGEGAYTSEVTFDREGTLSTIRCNPPPVG